MNLNFITRQYIISFCVKIPKTTTRFNNSLGGLIGSARSCCAQDWIYSKWIKQNRKRRMELSLGETRRKFPESSFSGVSQDGLIPLARSCNNMFEILPTRDAHWRLLKVFIGGWPHRQLLPASKYQNSRLPEGKQVFSINHTVCTNSKLPVQIQKTTLSGNDGNTPEVQVPKPKANLASRLF